MAALRLWSAAAVVCGFSLIGCDVGRSPQVAEVSTDPSEALATIGVTAEEQYQAAVSLLASHTTEQRVAEQACELFDAAAQLGHVESMVEASRCYLSRRWPPNQAMAMMWLARAASEGNAEAQYTLATKKALISRDGVFLNASSESHNVAVTEFIELLKASSERKFAPAMYALGMSYVVGLYESPQVSARTLVPIDRELGAKLIRDSADLGYWRAQWAAAVLYQAGFHPVSADPILSDHYWELLRNQTSIDSALGIAELYDFKVKREYKEGRNKYRGRNLSWAETNAIALEWYQRAAAEGSPAALHALAEMFREGRGTGSNESASLKYMKDAAEAGDVRAMKYLGDAYASGRGVVKDYGEAFRWQAKAVIALPSQLEASELGRMRAEFGMMYERGWGTSADPVLSYAWYNIAVADGYSAARSLRERLERKLSSAQLAEAQSISREWQPGAPLVRLPGAPEMVRGPQDGGSNQESLRVTAVGSAFFISADGHMLTNQHVVEGCKELRLPLLAIGVNLVIADKVNDLALLKVASEVPAWLVLADPEHIMQGEKIYVFGYPLDGYLHSQGNFTEGVLSALSGPGNDSTLLQITAPVQPGNSGGPAIGSRGTVMGVVVGKANAIKIAVVTGDIPQNVNFAVSGQAVRNFLDANQVRYATGGRLPSWKKEPSELAGIARRATTKIECLN